MAEHHILVLEGEGTFRLAHAEFQINEDRTLAWTRVGPIILKANPQQRLLLLHHAIPLAAKKVDKPLATTLADEIRGPEASVETSSPMPSNETATAEPLPVPNPSAQSHLVSKNHDAGISKWLTRFRQSLLNVFD